jgi:hypothetical protein
MIRTPGEPRVRSSRYIGAFPQTRTRRYCVAGQDGGQSIALGGKSGGKTLFLFSDTLLLAAGDHRDRAHSPIPMPLPIGTENLFLANCGAVGQSTDLPGALTSLQYYEDAEGLPLEILQSDARERFRQLRFWPEHGIFLNDRVYFYYLGVATVDPTSVWGFRTIGAGVAELNPETGEARRVSVRGDSLPWRNQAADFHFGVHVILEQGWVFVFGSVRDGIQSTGWLARVRPDRITEPAEYEFLTSAGPEWSPNMAESCSLGPTASEFSVSWNAFLGKYAMIYVEEYCKRLMLRTSDQLWGPYSEPLDLIGVPHQESSLFVYLGFEHAAFQQQDGRKIFVSYCEPHFSSSSLVTLTFDRAT